MSKGILEFDLPEEREEFETAQKGGAYAAATWSFKEWLYRRFKHEDPKNKAVRDFYQEVVNQFNLEFEDLI